MARDNIVSLSSYIKCKIVSNETLEKFHTKEYLKSLTNLSEVGNIIEFNLNNISNLVPGFVKMVISPSWIMEKWLINPFKYQTGRYFQVL